MARLAIGNLRYFAAYGAKVPCKIFGNAGKAFSHGYYGIIGDRFVTEKNVRQGFLLNVGKIFGHDQGSFFEKLGEVRNGVGKSLFIPGIDRKRGAFEEHGKVAVVFFPRGKQSRPRTAGFGCGIPVRDGVNGIGLVGSERIDAGGGKSGGQTGGSAAHDRKVTIQGNLFGSGGWRVVRVGRAGGAAVPRGGGSFTGSVRRCGGRTGAKNAEKYRTKQAQGKNTFHAYDSFLRRRI